eukprot:4315081-Pyramimonas_sp.AAC.1
MRARAPALTRLRATCNDATRDMRRRDMRPCDTRGGISCARLGVPDPPSIASVLTLNNRFRVWVWVWVWVWGLDGGSNTPRDSPAMSKTRRGSVGNGAVPVVGIPIGRGAHAEHSPGGAKSRRGSNAGTPPAWIPGGIDTTGLLSPTGAPSQTPRTP